MSEWDNKVIDIDEALERVLGHNDMYQRWLDSFFSEATLEPVKSAFSACDYEAAHKAAHKLKGTAANLSVTRLADAAIELDELVKKCVPFSDMQTQLNKVNDEFSAAMTMYAGNREYVIAYRP